MADITMCLTENCPLSNNCHRKTAIPDKYQSMSCFDEFLNRNDKICEMYYEWNGDKE